MKTAFRLLAAIGAILLLTGCGGKKTPAYRQVNPEEAAAMMESETDYILLDVRTQQEYKQGHIPGAICVPNEAIGSGEISELPDKEQLILVYCRSGNRSKKACATLSDLGFENVVDFGGISEWPGTIVK